ncbi:MAG: hypothetical protein EOL88_06400 [Bacteroidia bacterium]|nr:hypothetical protein [Bacteroidia bacterium]
MEHQFIEAGRVNFYWYCKKREPDFYRPEREHLRILCDTLDAFLKNKLLKPNGEPYNKIQIALPPRHGKSRTLVNLSTWALGRNPLEERIICQSYNNNLAQDFSRYTRDAIAEERQYPEQYIFSDFFPNVTINRSNKSVAKWAIKGSFLSYIGSGIGGMVTGKGGSLIIIDDPVKNAEEAMNINNLEKIYLWYTGTLVSRADALKGEAKIILNHTRWSKYDLAGRLLSDEPEEWYVLTMPVYDEENDTMLCEDILSKKEYFTRRNLAFKNSKPKMIFLANYHQRIVELEGALLSNFNEYDPNTFEANTRIRLLMDYADTGKDYFFAVFYTTNRNIQIYIHDIIFTQDKQELYEPLLKQKIEQYQPIKVYVERQGGGKQATIGIMNSVKYRRPRNDIQAFHQSLNKKIKILRYSSFVSENTFYPKGWDTRWSKFYDHITTFQAVLDNNDIFDGIDGLCEVVRREKLARRGGMKISN